MGIQKIKLTSTVYSKKGIDMIAGPSSNEGPDGWVWDKNKIANRLIPTTLHEKYAGGIDYNLDEGVSILDWNNFAFEDIQLSKINEISFNGVDLWNPNFTAGTYFLYGKKINLYSDYSVAGIAEEAEKEECYSFELNEKFKLDSLSLSIYKRSFNNVKFPYLSWEYSSSKKGRFFNVEGNLCKTNNNEKVKIGLNTFKSKEIKSTWEHKGSSRKEGRYLFSEYFPIKKGSLKVYAIRENKIVIFNESEEFLSEKMEFRCDYDLGIIETSGKKHREVYSKNFIKETATSIEISPEENLKSWPLQGEVQIGEEIVYYQNKSKNKIYGCLRGFKNTQAKEINIGEKISLNQKSSGLGEEYDLYISYEAVPRYEYEVEDRRVRRGNKLGYLDLHPYSNLKNNGIIQLSTVDTNVASLELEIDAENIGGNVFGPAYFGIDHKFITARAKDSLGNEIEGIEISVHINGNSPGYFSGNTKRYVDISNNEGEIYTAYTCPYDWEEISKEVYKVEHKNNESILTIEPIEDLQSFDKESITIYEVLKDDPVFGYNGIKFEIIDSGNDFDLDGKVYLKSWIKVYGKKMNFVDSFSNSKLSIEWHDGGQSTFYIDEIIQDSNYKEDQEVILILDQKSGLFDTSKIAKEAWIFERKTVAEPDQPNSLEWNTYHKIGRLKVLYEWNPIAMHPVTKQPGAYYPVRPLKMLSNQQLTLKGEIELPDAFDKNKNLGAYRIVCGSTVSFYATCKDPLTNKTIVSNTIRLRLDLPKYLNGVSFDEGLPVPYGFGLVSEELEVGTGLGGANFISINPIENI